MICVVSVFKIKTILVKCKYYCNFLRKGEQIRGFLEAMSDNGFLKNDKIINPNDKMILSFEVKPMAGENHEAVLANSKRVFKQAWSLL